MAAFAEALESRALLTAAIAGITETVFVEGINRATAMEFAPDGRLFVCSQGGALRVVKNGQLLETPFVNLPANDIGERGLLGIAFDPDYASNRFVYVYWTTNDPTVHNKISRFTADATNPDVAAAGSEVTILNLADLQPSNHNGGAIHFGNDGKLYVGVGENGAPSRSQDPADLFGKLLRINPDGSVPSDNPFASASPGGEVWASGLRNPYTFAVQKETGRIFINDVGQGSFEEINEGAAGANYGWPATEGATANPQFATPFLAYPHGDADGSRAITGGTFYPTQPTRLADNSISPANLPAAFAGDYFYADLTGGYVKHVDLTNDSRAVQKIATDIDSPVDLKVGADGALYVLSYNGGRVLRLASESAVDLSATIEATATGIIVGGDKGKANVRITNNGPSRLNGRVTVRLLLSTDGVADGSDAVVLTTTKKLTLKSAANKLLNLNFKYPAVADGQYLLLGQVDPDNMTPETNEENNVAVPADAFIVRFPGTDFTGSFVEPTPTAFAVGSKGKVTLSILNGGNITAKGKLQITLFAAADSEGSPVGSPLKVTSSAISIKPGARKSIALKFTLPADLAAGTYVFGAAIDSGAAFSELTETDNLALAASPFTVA